MQQHDVRGGCLVIQVFVLLNANLITKKEPMEPPIYRERSMLMLPKLWSLNLSSTIENSKVIFVIASFVSLDRVVNMLTAAASIFCIWSWKLRAFELCKVLFVNIETAGAAEILLIYKVHFINNDRAHLSVSRCANMLMMHSQSPFFAQLTSGLLMKKAQKRGSLSSGL